MTTRYYKTKAPAVIAAYTQLMADREALRQAVMAFAARFGAEGKLFANPLRFAGLVFPKRQRPPVAHWCRPTYIGIQWPRRRPLPPVGTAERAARMALLAEWDENVPTAQVSDDALFAVLGVSATDFRGYGGDGSLNLVVRGGWLYAAADPVPLHAMTEILGSEYAAALAAKP